MKCAYNTVNCNHCKANIRIDHFQHHIQNECVYRTMQCQHCKDPVVAKEYEVSHYCKVVAIVNKSLNVSLLAARVLWNHVCSQMVCPILLYFTHRYEQGVMCNYVRQK